MGGRGQGQLRGQTCALGWSSAPREEAAGQPEPEAREPSTREARNRAGLLREQQAGARPSQSAAVGMKQEVRFLRGSR